LLLLVSGALAMIRVICPNCGSKLNAKDELAGQTRKCPKCAQPVLIVADAPPTPPAAGTGERSAAIQVDAEEGLPVLDLPDRLNRESHYLICDRTSLAASWENNGAGWMLKTTAGFISAKRNRDSLPTQGDFKLVELKFHVLPEGKRLVGLTVYQLATRWALTALNQGDDQIMAKLTGMGSLNRDQKNAVRQALRDQFMRQVWQDAAAVLEYLANTDFHSPGVG
jgi:hypothetical protein